MTLNVFLLLGNHHHYPSLELSHAPKLKVYANETIPSHFPLPLVPVTTIPHSVSMNSDMLATSYKWRHVVFIFP